MLTLLVIVATAALAALALGGLRLLQHVDRALEAPVRPEPGRSAGPPPA